MASRPRAAILGGAGPAAWLPLAVCAIAGFAQALGQTAAIGVGLACFLAGLAHGAGDENGGRIAPYQLHHAVAYLLSGIALAALFLAAPLAALAVFLLLSAWHVATGDMLGRRIDYSIAALLIGGSALFRPGETGSIFAALTGQAMSASFMVPLAAVGAVGCAFAMVAAWRNETGWPVAAACAVAALAFHPVLAAGVIFLIGHAAPVQLRQLAAYGTAETWAAVRLPLALAMIGSVAIGLAAMEGWLALPVIAALAFGLVTPHMLAERIEP